MSDSGDMGECKSMSCKEGSPISTALSLVRYPLGISLFLLPWAMKFGGIVAGPIFVALFVVVNAYRSLVLTKIAEELTESGVASPGGYSDWWLLENSLGKVRRTSVNCYLVMFSTLQWISLLGHACTFFAFAGLTFNEEYPNTIWTGIQGDRVSIAFCVTAVVVVHVVTQWVRNLLHDSKSGCCEFCSGAFFVLVPVLVAVFIGIPIVVNFAATLLKERTVIHPSIEVDGTNFGLLLAGLAFVVGATPDDVTAPYGGSANRKDFPVILICVGVISTVILAGFGIAVFLAFGDVTCASVTFNLPLDGTRQYMAVRVLAALSALVFLAFRHQIDPKLSSRLSKPEIVCDIIFKVIFLAVSGALAAGVPSFNGLACLFGSISSFAMTLIFPFFCDIMLHVTGGRSRDLDDEGRDLISGDAERPTGDIQISGARVARDVIFMVLGAAGLIYGLYSTIVFLQSHGIDHAMQGCHDIIPTNTSVASY